MVLDREVQEVRGFGFDRRVSRLAEHALFEVGEQAREPLLAFLAEQFRRLAASDQIRLQARDLPTRLASAGQPAAGPAFGFAQQPFVEALQ